MGRAQPTISEILSGKRLISPEIAIEFEDALNGEVHAIDLLGKQSEYLLKNARKENGSSDIRLKSRIQEEFPISEMEKRQWIPKKKSAEGKLSALLEFANNSVDLDHIAPPFPTVALARQSETLGYLSPTSKASRAWQFRVRELAEITPVKEFDHSTFVTKGMVELRALAKDLKGVARVPQTLARYGVRFVVVSHLTKTKLDGAAMWLDGDERRQPVIALTLRFGHIDKFWFNLAHEIQHIKHLHEFSVDVETDAHHSTAEDGLQEIEDQANDGASEWLIPQARLSSFIRRNSPKFTESSIIAFSEMVDVHPGILVGTLQHMGDLSYKTRLTRFKTDIRDQVFLAAMADGFPSLPVVKTKRITNW